MTTLSLSPTTLDFSDLLAQLSTDLGSKDAWKGSVETQTGQQLLRMISAVGALDLARIRRALQDAFPDTALSDRAAYALASYLGVRLARKSPAAVTVTLTSTTAVTLPAFTAFQGGGTFLFNRDAIVLSANVATSVTLYQGIVNTKTVAGLGKSYSMFASSETGFAVSDSDVEVRVNGAIITRSTDGMWELAGVPGCVDRTLPDGRLMIEFGNDRYGSNPSVSDTVQIRYVTTAGGDGNSLNLLGKALTSSAFPTVSGKATTQPFGGSDENAALLYKNVAAPTFGTFGAAITRSQYFTTALSYTGVLDCAMFAQRDINPYALEWMNVIRVVLLTSSPWTDVQKAAFLAYMDAKTAFAPRFVLVSSVAVSVPVTLKLFCYNSANADEEVTKAKAAITALFAPKRGTLDLDVYPYDITDAVRAACPGVEYMHLSAPSSPVLVSAKTATSITPTVATRTALNPIPAGTYEYGVVVVRADGSLTSKVYTSITLSDSTHVVDISWRHVAGATSYQVVRKSPTAFGVRTTRVTPAGAVEGATLTATDTALNTTGSPPPTQNTVPIRYASLGALSVTAAYSTRNLSSR